MGEARRRKASSESAAGVDALADRAKFAHALRAVLSPLGNAKGVEGGDCYSYAVVGTQALRRLGVPASLQVGDALWRVGPGNGDLIHHVASVGGPTFGPRPDAMTVFHAWIRIESDHAAPAQLVDFTTWQLRLKAQLLDLADGKRTCVQFCPDYLWIPEKKARAMTVRQVVDSYSAGVYAYFPQPHVQGLLQPKPEDVAMMTEAALCCYAELLAGRALPAEL